MVIMIPWQIEKWLFTVLYIFSSKIRLQAVCFVITVFFLWGTVDRVHAWGASSGPWGTKVEVPAKNDFLSSIHPNGSSFLPLICVVLFFCPWGKTDDCSQSSVRSSRSSTQNSQRNVQPFSIYILGFTGNWFEIKMVANYSKPSVTVILRENRGP